MVTAQNYDAVTRQFEIWGDGIRGDLPAEWNARLKRAPRRVI